MRELQGGNKSVAMPAGPIQFLNCYWEKFQDDLVPEEHSWESQREERDRKREKNRHSRLNSQGC